MKIKDAIKILQGYNKDMPVFMTLWLPDDVITQARIDDIEITKEQSEQIIDGIDYCAGENDPMWFSISEAIKEYDESSKPNDIMAEYKAKKEYELITNGYS
jgi:hypothetical protein